MRQIFTFVIWEEEEEEEFNKTGSVMCLEESPGLHKGQCELTAQNYTYFGGKISLTIVKLKLRFYFTPHIILKYFSLYCFSSL